MNPLMQIWYRKHLSILFVPVKCSHVVEVFLQVRISVTVQIAIVVSSAWVKTGMAVLPMVWHSITIAIPCSRSMNLGKPGISTHFIL